MSGVVVAIVILGCVAMANNSSSNNNTTKVNGFVVFLAILLVVFSQGIQAVQVCMGVYLLFV
jgi:hypothetical protein